MAVEAEETGVSHAPINNTPLASTEVKEPVTYDDEPAGDAPRPTGWMYKQLKVGGKFTPYYASPKIQLIMVSFVCFLCPGMFNALSGMGGGGKADPTLADNMVMLSISVYSAAAS
jgi:hypothetical protein